MHQTRCYNRHQIKLIEMATGGMRSQAKRGKTKNQCKTLIK